MDNDAKISSSKSKACAFFGSVWFRCITVLLVLSVILGGTLTILNDVLYVSPEERTDRAIKKLYDGNIPTYSVILDVDSAIDGVDKTAIEFNLDGDQNIEGKINKIYNISGENGEYDLLFQSVGFEGYKGGSITVWVKVKNTADGKKIVEQVLLQSYDKQTLMSKLNGTYYNKYLVDVTEAYKNGQFFTTENGKGQFTNAVSGATYSANAGNNAVNCVIAYIGGAN